MSKMKIISESCVVCVFVCFTGVRVAGKDERDMMTEA